MIKLRGAIWLAVFQIEVERWTGEEGQSGSVRNAKGKRWKTSPTALGSLEI